MGGGVRRIATQAVLWAGPIGVALATLALLVSAPYFRSGPGVPTAGDERAWNAVWIALGILGLGGSVGFVANAAWLVIAARARRRPTRLEWLRTASGLALGVALGFLWFGR
jgi:Na+/H+ antiporter NhaD/arsenite permease-like protein